MSRVTEIRCVGYGVEDFAAERAFYADVWGLVEVAAEEGTAWFKTHGHDEQVEVEIVEPHPSILVLIFQRFYELDRLIASCNWRDREVRCAIWKS